MRVSLDNDKVDDLFDSSHDSEHVLSGQFLQIVDAPHSGTQQMSEQGWISGNVLETLWRAERKKKCLLEIFAIENFLILAALMRCNPQGFIKWTVEAAANLK